MLMMVFLGMLLIPSRSVIGQSAGTMRILDSTTGSNTNTLGNASAQMPQGGYPFTVNITIEGHFDSLFTFQVAVEYDKTKVNFTGGSIPTKDPNFVFFDKLVVMPPGPNVDDQYAQYGVVTMGATLIIESLNVSKGLLCQLSFVAQRVGNSTLDLITQTLNPTVDRTFLLNPELNEIPITTQGFSVSTYAAPSPPVPLFEFTPRFPQVNENVTLDALKSYDPVGNITSYYWDFDDGTTLTTNEIKVLHAFNASRLYYVNLTVYNNFTFSGSIIHEIQVGRVPFANFTYSPKELMPSNIVTFDASLSDDADGTIARYVWNFGDNSPLNDSTIENATHTYMHKGVFWVQLIVYDNNGLYNSTSQEVFVGKRPTVLASFKPERPFAYEAVTFNASMIQAGEASDYITMLKWDFGDYNVTDVNVTISNLPNPFVITHIYYGEGGIYTISVTAFDNNGLYSSYAFEVDVQELPQQGAPNYALYVGIAVAVIAIAILAVIVVKRRKK